MSKHRFFPYFLILAAGLIWGATFSLALMSTAKGAHPLAISAWQVVITSVFLMVFCLFSGVPVFRLRHIRHYVLIAVVGITAPNLAYYYAAPYLSAGILSITVSTVPLLTYAIMLLLHYESVLFKRVFGIVLGMVAVLLLVLPDQGLDSDDANFWILLALLSSVMYSIENVYISEGVDHSIDVREILSGSNIIAIALQFPLAIYLGVDEPVSWLVTVPGMALVGIALGSSVAYSMFFYTIKTAGPVFASQCAYVVTLSGVFWGIVIFGEEHSIWVWLSILVLMIGLFLVTPNRSSLQAASEILATNEN